jgi:hypothetical protein
MPIETPQLNFTPYKPDPANAPQVPQINPPTQPNTTEGFIPKSGAVAHVVTDAVRGWMQGREIAQQNQQKKAQQHIQTADYVYNITKDNYNDLLRQGKAKDSPEVQQAYQAAVGAWQARNQVLGQYVAPDQGEKPKGVGGKAKAAVKGVGKEMFGSLTPQMIPQAAMAILKNQPPPGLGMTVDDNLKTEELKGIKTQNESSELKLQQEKKDVEVKNEWTTLSQIPVDKQSPEQKQKLRMLDSIMTGPVTPDKQLEYDTAAAISANKPLTDAQRQIAYGKGWLQAPQVLQTQDGLNNYITSIGPDGKQLWKTKVGRQYREDQAAAAGRVMQAQQENMFHLYQKANPDMSDSDLWKMVSGGLAKNNEWVKHLLGDDPKKTEEQNVALDKAMHKVWADALKGPNGKAITDSWTNLVKPPPDGNMAGQFVFDGTIAPPTVETHWFSPDTQSYAGGLDAAGLKTNAERLRILLAGAMRDANPKMSVDEIQSAVERAVRLPEPSNSGPQSSGDGASKPTNMSPPPGMRSTGIGFMPNANTPQQMSSYPQETRTYQGATYVKDASGQWVLQEDR